MRTQVVQHDRHVGPAYWLSGCGWQSALETHGAPAVTLKQLILFIVAVCAVVWMLVIVVLGGLYGGAGQTRTIPLNSIRAPSAG